MFVHVHVFTRLCAPCRAMCMAAGAAPLEASRWAAGARAHANMSREEDALLASLQRIDADILQRGLQVRSG